MLTGINITSLDILKSIGEAILSGLFPLVIILGIFGSFILFRKFFPIQEVSPVVINVQKANKYGKCYLLSTGLLFLGWPIGGITTYNFLVWLSDKWFSLFNGNYVAPIEKAYWIGPSLFVGLLFGALFSTFILKIFLQNEYTSFINFFNSAWGFNSIKVMKLVVYGYLLLILVLIYIGLSSFTRFTEEGIYIHKPYLLAEEYHSYSQVVRIEEIVRKEKRSSDHTFTIEFIDGKRWSTIAVKDDEVLGIIPQIMNFVAKKSGKNFEKLILDGK